MLYSQALQETAFNYGILNSNLKMKVLWSFKTLKTLNPNNTAEHPQTLHEYNCQILKPYKLIGAQLVNKLPTYYTTYRLITMFKTDG